MWTILLAIISILARLPTRNTFFLRNSRDYDRPWTNVTIELPRYKGPVERNKSIDMTKIWSVCVYNKKRYIYQKRSCNRTIETNERNKTFVSKCIRGQAWRRSRDSSGITSLVDSRVYSRNLQSHANVFVERFQTEVGLTYTLTHSLSLT